MLSTTTVPLLLLAARSVYAVGCATHTFGHCEDGITHWYDPDDFQICDPLDCGGGRAPPKTNNPCCGSYKGTEACVDTPSYMSCLVAKATAATSSSVAAITAATTTTSESEIVVQTTMPTTSPTVAIVTSSFPVSPMPTNTDESSSGITTEPTTSGYTSQVTVTTRTNTQESGSSSSTSTSTSTGTGASSSGSTTSSGSQSTSTPNAAGRMEYDSLVVVAGAAFAGVLAMA
ncbi:hypothetical protein BKA67DRAFT_345180 [Truncatella angustata]|uniref:Uncharacterized protein n=1 Tax=Truncatella angustata TaxID=152316 RepID=A0A9P8ZVL0_9PEZI|nr:uncharacterized protein BKA67DRAFT_345180 [Truncatella angustata]KAH6652051.1 hypothetical protein BKA67DRAFT_345180 [Truncatella angustata]